MSAGHPPWCSCRTDVAGHLHDLADVVAIEIDLPARWVRVEGRVDAETVARAITPAGYHLRWAAPR